ncbi:Uncharacterised protein [Mycobacteroides abscessus subsp. abscessus]|uniref:hypothetical protein n=1 Tax=Mycobacteroides abscessus TaxID=36809 RepID=UPI00092C33D1|nr:hypothetical protein [Mycobacteroides abscessus]SIJ20352.1 Uncharacterised protein [Mycobacteroides abscessus subsp. abscessus]SLH39842.1 Uncharacterised protein [Mycobacteroides abscessus subsp. abscessus]
MLPTNGTLTIDAGVWAAFVSEKEGLEAQVRDMGRQMAVSAQKMTRMLDDANELAEEHDWCSVYDNLLERHGLPPRTQDYDAWVSVGLRLPMTQTARSSDAAEAALEDCDSRDRIAQYIYDLSRSSLDEAIDEWSVTSIEQA